MRCGFTNMAEETINTVENSTSVRIKKTRIRKYNLKVMLIVFFCMNGMIMVEWVSPGQLVLP